MAECCLNCGASFERRIDGGRRQKYRSEHCRRAFAKDALAYAERMVVAGLLTLDQMREGPCATPRCSRGPGPPFHAGRCPPRGTPLHRRP
jgi:hypothetical protein